MRGAEIGGYLGGVGELGHGTSCYRLFGGKGGKKGMQSTKIATCFFYPIECIEKKEKN